MHTRFTAHVNMKNVIRIVQVLFGLTFIAYGGLYLFYGFSLDAYPTVADGKVHPLNLHGHIVYLSHLQHQLMCSLETLGVIFGGAFGLLIAYSIYRQKQ